MPTARIVHPARSRIAARIGSLQDTDMRALGHRLAKEPRYSQLLILGAQLVCRILFLDLALSSVSAEVSAP